jgi:hypothetical protein
MASFRPVHRQLLVVLLTLLWGMQGRAFDGGGTMATPTTVEVDKLGSLPDYSSYHAHCLERERTMWGEVAELMEDLATAQCTCEYVGLEQEAGFDHETRERIAHHCARQARRRNKSRLIEWALPLHQQRKPK